MERYLKRGILFSAIVALALTVLGYLSDDDKPYGDMGQTVTEFMLMLFFMSGLCWFVYLLGYYTIATIRKLLR